MKCDDKERKKVVADACKKLFLEIDEKITPKYVQFMFLKFSTNIDFFFMNSILEIQIYFHLQAGRTKAGLRKHPT